MPETGAAVDPRRFPIPPAIPIVGLAASWLLGVALPLPWHRPSWAMWLGLVLFTVPFAFAIWAVRVFRSNNTPINPLGKVAGVVDDGPFAVTRNPMYLTQMVMYAGGALLFDLPWAWLLAIPVFLGLHFGVILPEERYLTATFGEAYLAYKARVRRWI